MPPLKDERRYHRRCLPSVLCALLAETHPLNDIVHFLHFFFFFFNGSGFIFSVFQHLVLFDSPVAATGESLNRPPKLHNKTRGGRGKKKQKNPQKTMSAISEQDSEAWIRGCLRSSQSNQTSRIDRDQEMERACWQPIGRRGSDGPAASGR